MGGLLSDLTLFTTFVCLGLNLWFAIYLLSRSRANAVAFRAIVALVAMAFYYNYVLNALVTGEVEKSPVRLFAQTIALIAWHDLTIYLLNPQQRQKRYTLARGIVLFSVVATVLIFTAPPPQPCDPIYICPSSTSYPNLIVVLFICFVFISILYNLWLIRKTDGLRSSTAFYLAILIGVGPVYSGFVGTVLNINVPRLLPNLLILAALILLAYSVARDRTFITHRTSTYDLPVTLITISAIVVIYLLVGRQFALAVTDLVLLAVLVVFTHSAYDFVRDFLDQLFHRQQRQMQRELDALGREATTSESLQRYLSRGLAVLCKNLNACGGFIAIRKDDQYTVVASLHSLPIGKLLPARELAHEGPAPEGFARPASAIFPGLAWLAPGYAGSEQCAVIGVGPRKDKVLYDEEDLYWLEDIAHEISQIVHFNYPARSPVLQDTLAESSAPGLEINQPIGQDTLIQGTLDQGGLLSALAYKPDQELVECVEEGYQHLNDYDVLGKSRLVELFGIQAADHLECGKLVHDKLVQILEKLRPAGQPPSEPLPREWHAYTILHDSYVEDRLSRDIMGKLYIGEGTYYRLRRQALRGITRAVVEMGTGS